MIALLLLAAAHPHGTPPPPPPPPTQIDDLPIDVLPRQALPASGCAAYLWTATELRRLVAMATAEPARLRIVLDGATIDLPRMAQRGVANFGLTDSADYAIAGTRATLDLRIETRRDLVKGAVVPDGVLRIDRDGRDGVVLPVTGLIGCAG